MCACMCASLTVCVCVEPRCTYVFLHLHVTSRVYVCTNVCMYVYEAVFLNVITTNNYQ